MSTKESIIKKLWIVMVVMLTASLSMYGCSNDQNSEPEGISETVEETQDAASESQESSNADGAKTLILYYDHSENMGGTDGMSVDAVTSASLDGDHPDGVDQNNILVIVDEIKNKTSADVFSVRVNEPYDPSYDDMVYVAQDDINDDKHFTFAEDIDNLDEYDTIYIGMPVWWSKLPQPMKVFVDEHDLSGKTIIPFGIHRGSGFGAMIGQLEELEPDATVIKDGYTVNATTANDTVRKEVDEWLDTL